MNAYTIASRKSAILAAALFLMFWWGAAAAQAQVLPADIELEGYAWSSTIGWISLNCKNGGPTGGDVCGASDYRVTMRENGLIDGYAWSSHIGWIKFGGLSSFPTAPGNINSNARVVAAGTDYVFDGWARACAGTLPGDCSSMVNSPSGWDGWISLRGTGPNYEIRFATSTGMYPSSFAWGSTVVGWIDFAVGAFFPPAIGAFALVTPGEVLVKSAPTAIPTFDNVRFAALVTNGPASGTRPFTLELETAGGVLISSISGTYDFGTNSFSELLRFNGVDAHPLSQPHRATLTVDSSSMTIPVQLDVDPPLIDSFTAQQDLVRKGDNTTLEWAIDSAQTYDLECTVTGPGVNMTFTYVVDVSPLTGSTPTATLQNEARYQLQCTNPYVDPLTIPLEVTSVRVIPTFQES